MSDPPFREGAKKYPLLYVHWDPIQKLCAFYDGPVDDYGNLNRNSPIDANPDAVYLLKSATRIARDRLRYSLNSEICTLAWTLQKPLDLWLDLMRAHGRGFHRRTQAKALGASYLRRGLRPPPSLLMEFEDGDILRVFQESADFWDDIEALGFGAEIGESANPDETAERERATAPSAMDPETWLDIEERFLKLRNECGGKLEARWFPNGRFDGSQWLLAITGPPARGFDKKYEEIAQRAARKLGYLPTRASVDRWLDLLKLDKPEFFHGKREQSTEATFGYIEDICSVSAVYCRERDDPDFATKRRSAEPIETEVVNHLTSYPAKVETQSAPYPQHATSDPANPASGPERDLTREKIERHLVGKHAITREKVMGLLGIKDRRLRQLLKGGALEQTLHKLITVASIRKYLNFPENDSARSGSKRQ